METPDVDELLKLLKKVEFLKVRRPGAGVGMHQYVMPGLSIGIACSCVDCRNLGCNECPPDFRWKDDAHRSHAGEIESARGTNLASPPGMALRACRVGLFHKDGECPCTYFYTL